jgi:hypothetical protein
LLRRAIFDFSSMCLLVRRPADGKIADWFISATAQIMANRKDACNRFDCGGVNRTSSFGVAAVAVSGPAIGDRRHRLGLVDLDARTPNAPNGHASVTPVQIAENRVGADGAL